MNEMKMKIKNWWIWRRGKERWIDDRRWTSGGACYEKKKEKNK